MVYAFSLTFFSTLFLTEIFSPAPEALRDHDFKHEMRLGKGQDDLDKTLRVTKERAQQYNMFYSFSPEKISEKQSFIFFIQKLAVNTKDKYNTPRTLNQQQYLQSCEYV